MAGAPNSDAERHSRLAQLEEGLLGLLHFYEQFQRGVQKGTPSKQGGTTAH